MVTLYPFVCVGGLMLRCIIDSFIMLVNVVLLISYVSSVFLCSSHCLYFSVILIISYRSVCVCVWCRGHYVLVRCCIVVLILGVVQFFCLIIRSSRRLLSLWDNFFMRLPIILVVLMYSASWDCISHYILLGPTWPRNFEPSCGICPLLRNFNISAEFRGIWEIIGD